MVTLGVGQRTDILVTANGSSTDAVFMRSDISAFCVNDNLAHSQKPGSFPDPGKSRDLLRKRRQKQDTDINPGAL